MEIVVAPAGGLARCVYAEAIDLARLGEVEIRRASHVEPDGRGGGWRADLSPVGGPSLGPFRLRSEALAAEVTWLTPHWLMAEPHHQPRKEGPAHEGRADPDPVRAGAGVRRLPGRLPRRAAGGVTNRVVDDAECLCAGDDTKAGHPTGGGA